MALSLEETTTAIENAILAALAPIGAAAMNTYTAMQDVHLMKNRREDLALSILIGLLSVTESRTPKDVVPQAFAYADEFIAFVNGD